MIVRGLLCVGVKIYHICISQRGLRVIASVMRALFSQPLTLLSLSNYRALNGFILSLVFEVYFYVCCM